jgi:hypothetical protein
VIETEEHQEEFTGEFDGDPTGAIRPLFKEAGGLARLEAHNRGLPAEKRVRQVDQLVVCLANS